MAEEKKQKSNKVVVVVLIVVVGFLTGLSLFTGYMAFFEQKEEIVRLTENHTTEKSRADRLQEDANRVKSILDGMNLENVDSLAAGYKEAMAKNAELSEKAEELKAKIAQFMEIANTSDPETAKNYYRQIKTDLFRLRVEVRKLKKRNQELIAENARLKDDNNKLTADLSNERANSRALSEKSDKLQAQVNIGKRLRAFDLVAEGIKVRRNGKEKVTKRAKRAQKIRVAFTIDKNELTSSGMKKVYLRIVGPNDQVLTDGGSTFVHKGEEMAFTSMSEVNYQNASEDVVMYAKNFFSQKFEKGTYMANIYCEGALIGTSQLSLK